MKTVFSEHGSKRIRTRLSMTKTVLSDILDNHKTIDVAIEPGTNRIHRLFFSSKDQCCFLAIQDSKTGTLITVVPVNNRGMGKNISLEAQDAAQRIIERNKSQPEQAELGGDKSVEMSTRKLKFLAYTTDGSNSIKIIHFGTELQSSGVFQIDNLQHNESFVKQFQQTLRGVMRRKKLSTSGIQTLYVRTGKKQKLFLIEESIAQKLLNSDYSATVH